MNLTLSLGILVPRKIIPLITAHMGYLLILKIRGGTIAIIDPGGSERQKVFGLERFLKNYEGL
jgi:hypothetical protein